MNSTIRARIDEKIKEDASAVLAASGLTVSDAVRMMMIRVAAEKKLPFEPLVPNAETIEAIKDARAGKVKSVNSIDALMSELNADD